MQPRLLFVALVAALSFIAANSENSVGCDHCSQVCPCQKTCRLVCETKKVEITCWGCKCEDFCIPGPSKPGCKHCEWVCEDCDAACDPKGVHTQAKKFVWTEWIPGCATIHTRKKLMKKTVTKTIPSYKWVVEELCPHCRANAQSASVPTGTEIPQPPTSAGAAILPVSYVEATPSLITDEESRVQPAAPKSSQSFLKLPWQR